MSRECGISSEKKIGLILPDLNDRFFSSCAYQVQRHANACGYSVQVESSTRRPENEVNLAVRLAQYGSHGLLIITSLECPNTRLKQLHGERLPIVALDRPIPGLETDTVLVENCEGARMAVEHLILQGHKRVACLGYDERTYAVQQRIAGHKEAMTNAGLIPELVLSSPAQWRVEAVLDKMLRRRSPVTAIFSMNHHTSANLMRVLDKMKIKVPDDVAVVGFDGLPSAAPLMQKLTVVEQDPHELSVRAVDLLLRRVIARHANEVYATATFFLSTRLLVGATCGAHVAIGGELGPRSRRRLLRNSFVESGQPSS